MVAAVAEGSILAKFQIRKLQGYKDPKTSLDLRLLKFLSLTDCSGQYGTGLKFHSLAGIKAFTATFEDGSGRPRRFYGGEVFSLTKNEVGDALIAVT